MNENIEKEIEKANLLIIIYDNFFLSEKNVLLCISGTFFFLIHVLLCICYKLQIYQILIYVYNQRQATNKNQQFIDNYIFEQKQK